MLKNILNILTKLPDMNIPSPRTHNKKPEQMTRQQLIHALYTIISEQESIMKIFDERFDGFTQKFREIEKKYMIEQEYGRKVVEEQILNQKTIKQLRTRVNLLKSENIVLKSRLEYQESQRAKGNDEEKDEHRDSENKKLDLELKKMRQENSSFKQKIKKIRLSVLEFLKTIEKYFLNNDCVQNAFLQEIFILKQSLK